MKQPQKGRDKMKINRFEFFTGQAFTALGGAALHQGRAAEGILVMSFAVIWQLGALTPAKGKGSRAND